MKLNNFGFVLPVTLGLLMIVAALLGVTFRYTSWAARSTRSYLATSRCRLAAQSAIEDAKVQIQDGFREYSGGASATLIKVDPKQVKVYDWFENVSADRKTIGVGKRGELTLTSPITINGCTVYVGIGKKVTKESSIATVPIVATAVYTYPDGQTTEITIQERICFATGQSQVFNYAYFVNNYGWMNGATIIINGDMRANGNVNVNQSIINGYIYAAQNDELGVDGEVTLAGSPKIYSSSYYRSRVSTSARPTNPPGTSGKGIQDWSGGFEAPNSSSTSSVTIRKALKSTAGDLIVNEGYDSLPMPYVSELENYKSYAREWRDDLDRQSTLTRPQVTFTDASGANRTTGGDTITAVYSGVGPSGDVNLADNGAIVLIGTQSNPIRINGPVVVDSDVIIKGYVSGQGTIYSGRNIHIIGNVTYLNSPTWTHPDNNPEATRDRNQNADMLGLIAKGNIVMGKYPDQAWHSSIDKYINGGTSSVVEKYQCDATDQDIGYPYPQKFGGDYTAVEAVGAKQKIRPKTTSTTVVTGKDRWGRDITSTVKKTTLVNEGNRRYYESVCDDAIITSKAEDINRIDAVLYNNHGIFGRIGKANSSFSLNGSLVCRDEALVAGAGNGLNFNWDIRLKPDSAEGLNGLGLPVGMQEPYTVSWQEVPSSMNEVYMRRTNP